MQRNPKVRGHPYHTVKFVAQSAGILRLGVAMQKNPDHGLAFLNYVAISEKRNYTLRIWQMKDGEFPVTQLT
jgi:hypothetical protein